MLEVEIIGGMVTFSSVSFDKIYVESYLKLRASALYDLTTLILEKNNKFGIKHHLFSMKNYINKSYENMQASK